MRPLRRFFKRLTSWARTRQDEERLQAEIEDHLALLTADHIRAGLSPAEARRQAILKFGGLQAIRETYRDQKGLPSLESLLQDMRYALRRLRMAPAFTITTILTLSLGIGATTSIFTLVHAVLLKSLPVANPADLYRLGREARCCYWGGYSQEKEFSLVSYDLYKYFRDHTQGFAELAAFSAVNLRFGVRRAGSSEPAQSYPGEFVSGNYFTMFGISAYAGRAVTPADDRPGAPPVAVMSYRLWQQVYAASPSVIGSVFNFNGKPFTIVGITPPGFFGDTLRSAPPDFFLPLHAELLLEGDLYEVAQHWLQLIGRVRPHAVATAIEAQMRVELKQWLLSHWNEMSPNERAKLPAQTLYVEPGGAGITGMRDEYQHWLQILMLISGFVLLIVCANVANLMLVRGMERRRQISLSMALGAPASRVVRQALTESLLLSFAGGAAGLAISYAGARLILHFVFPKVGGLAGIPIAASPSIPVLLFAFGVSMVAGIAFGIVPAWMATRVDPIEALRGARSTARAGSLPRQTLVVFQAALSLVLLSASGLLTVALHRLETQHFGFEPDRRFVMNIEPRNAGYHSEQLTLLYRQMHDSLSAIPGISSVAFCIYSPLGGNNWGTWVRIDGHPAPGPNDNNFVFWNRVTAGYFEVTGNRILRGRGISAQDTAASPHVAVINEAFARKFFPSEDPLGKHFGQHDIGSEREYEVVGIAEDARYFMSQLDKPIPPSFFLPGEQRDFSSQPRPVELNPGSHFLHDAVLVTTPGAALPTTRIRQVMGSINPDLAILSIRPLREQISGAFRQQTLIARLTSFFGLLSLVLSSIGLYGVTAYNAGRRINEVGVRMALGATRIQIVRLVVQGALALICLGLLIGLPLAFAAGRFLGSQLYGLNPHQPLVLIAAVTSLGLSALAAALIPALRASRISPMEALRVE